MGTWTRSGSETQWAPRFREVSREDLARYQDGAEPLPAWLPSRESRVARGDMAWERFITSSMVERGITEASAVIGESIAASSRASPAAA